jgi:ABC-type Zn uptake system ZnuABC Zn-binding protein ZnuA
MNDMAYIDREKLEKYLREQVDECPKIGLHNPTGYGARLGLNMAIAYVKALSTEDVVPRSEVEELQKKLNEQDFTNMILRANGHSPVIEQAKQEVASEIFEEIEKHLPYLNQQGWVENLKSTLAELKKKYIGE